MASTVELTRIVRGLNTIKTVGAAMKAARRAQSDARAAIGLLGVRSDIGGGVAQRKALASSIAALDRELKNFGGAGDAAVGLSWNALRAAINRAYVEIAGAEGLAEAAAETPIDVAIAHKLLGDSAGWWVSYGAELAREPNVIKRAGLVVGDAGRGAIKTAQNVAAPVLEAGSGLVLSVLKSLWPLLLIGGVLLVGVAYVAVKSGAAKPVRLIP